MPLVPLTFPPKLRCVDKEVITFPLELQSLKVANSEYEGKKVPAYAIVRTDTKEILGLVSTKLRFVPHVIIVDAFEDTLKRAGVEVELCDINFGGIYKSTIDINYLLPEFEFDIEGDKWVPCFQLTGYYETGIKHVVKTGFYRKDNMSLVLFKDLLLLTKDFRNRWYLDGSKEVNGLKEWINTFSDVRKTFRALHDESIDVVDVKRVIHSSLLNADRRLLGFYENRVLKKYVEIYGKTMYAVFNALIEYATHGVIVDPGLQKSAYSRSFDLQRQIGNVFFEGGIAKYLILYFYLVLYN